MSTQSPIYLSLPILRAPVMSEADEDTIDYDSVSDPSPLEFTFPGLMQTEPGLRYIGVILNANGGGSGFTIWARDALDERVLTMNVGKILYSLSSGLRVRGRMTFFYEDGREKAVSIPERFYRVE